MSTLTLRRITTEEDFSTLAQAWGALHTSARGSVFQTFDWLMNWWKVYKNRGYDLNVLTVWDDDKLVGVLPMFFETVFIFGAALFIWLRFLGVYEIYGEYQPLVDPDYSEVLAPLMAAFCLGELRERRCDLVSFFRYPAGSTFMKALLDAMRGEKIAMKHTENSIVRVVMDLPADWDSYLATLSSGERRSLGRRTRALVKHGVTVERRGYSLNGAADFDEFVRLHTLSWSERGIPGYFASSSKFEEFQGTITASLRQSNLARLYFLSKDGERIAAVQAFFVNGKCCFYLSGLNRRHELSHYSPGKVLLSLVIKDAIEEGYKIFDFQGGNEEYKLRLGGKETGFSKTLVWQRGLGTLKVMVFLMIREGRRFLVESIWRDGVRTPLKKLIRGGHVATPSHVHARDRAFDQ